MSVVTFTVVVPRGEGGCVEAPLLKGLLKGSGEGGDSTGEGVEAPLLKGSGEGGDSTGGVAGFPLMSCFFTCLYWTHNDVPLVVPSFAWTSSSPWEPSRVLWPST